MPRPPAAIATTADAPSLSLSRRYTSLVGLALGDRAQNHKDHPPEDPEQTHAEGDPSPQSGVAGRFHGAGVVTGRHLTVNLRRVDYGDDPERQATEDRRKDRLHQIV